MIYLTSDTHFYHNNIIRYCNRPFTSVDEMNETIINNWNAKVNRSDTVYFLGDFAFNSRFDEVNNIFNKLNGCKIGIKGNHDHSDVRKKLAWNAFFDFYDLKYKDMTFVLCHFPFLFWNKSTHGSIHCHGHCHSKQTNRENKVRRFDVGQDAWNYSPVSIVEIITLALSIPVNPHHEEV